MDGSDLQKDGPDQDYYTDPEEEERDPVENEQANNSVNVKLLSQGQVFIPDKGDVVVLPCRVTPKDVIRMWKKDTILIFQDQISLTEKENYNLTADGDLQVIVQSSEDYGQYECVIAASNTENMELVHQLVPRTSPTIQKLYVRENKRVVST